MFLIPGVSALDKDQPDHTSPNLPHHKGLSPREGPTTHTKPVSLQPSPDPVLCLNLKLWSVPSKTGEIFTSHIPNGCSGYTPFLPLDTGHASF